MGAALAIDQAELRDAIIQEFWYRNDLRYLLHSAQRKIDDTFQAIAGQLFVGNCARQFGKSFWAVTLAVQEAQSGPKKQIRYGAAFQTDLVEFIIPAFDKVLEDCPDDIEPVFLRGRNTYVFPNGSRIKLVGVDKNPNGLRGNSLDLVILDECGFIEKLEYIYKSVLIPATTHRPNCKIVLISTPPSTPAHPFVDFVERALAEECYAEFNIYQNPLIGPETIERLKRESGGEASTTWRREYLCELITDQDLQIIPEWRDEYIAEIPKDVYYDLYHKYVGMDLGVKDKTGAIFGYYEFLKARLVIENECEMSGAMMNTELLAGQIRSMEKDLWGEKPPFRRIADNNNPLLLLDLTSIHDLSFVSTGKDQLHAMINELRLFIQAGQLIVHPRCKNLIGCLKFGVWNLKRTEFARSSTYGHFDHLAALVYLVRNLLRNSNPIPADFQKAYHTHMLSNLNLNQPSQAGQALAKVFGFKS